MIILHSAPLQDKKINNLLLNEEKSLAIAKEATKFIKENYSWEKSIKLYIDSME